MKSRKIIFASAHRFDADIRLGSSHLARAFARRGWDVLFIEQPTSLLHLFHPVSAPAASRKLVPAFGGSARAHATGVRVLNAVALLPHVNMPLLRSRLTLEAWPRITYPSLPATIARMGFDDAAAFVFDSPYYHPLATTLPIPSVYRYADRMREFAGVTAAMLDTQQKTIRDSSLVLHTSEALASDMQDRAGPVLSLPNGVDLEPYLDKPAPPDELSGIRRPRIVYCGAFEKWFDAPLVAEAARQRRNVSFVMIGDTRPLGNALSGHPNIHMTGRIPHDRVAAFLCHADIGLIPFKPDGPEGLVEAINPLKLYEYCAAGLPVIAYRSREFERLDAPVSRYESVQGFIEAIDRLLTETGLEPSRRDERIRWAAGHSWDKRAEALEAAIASL